MVERGESQPSVTAAGENGVAVPYIVQGSEQPQDKHIATTAGVQAPAVGEDVVLEAGNLSPGGVLHLSTKRFYPTKGQHGKMFPIPYDQPASGSESGGNLVQRLFRLKARVTEENETQAK